MTIMRLKLSLPMATTRPQVSRLTIWTLRQKQVGLFLRSHLGRRWGRMLVRAVVVWELIRYRRKLPCFSFIPAFLPRSRVVGCIFGPCKRQSTIGIEFAEGSPGIISTHAFIATEHGFGFSIFDRIYQQIAPSLYAWM